jgi:hypothetical protein
MMQKVKAFYMKSQVITAQHIKLSSFHGSCTTVLFWVLQIVAVKCSDILEGHTVSVTGVTELVHVDDDIIQRQKCASYIGQLTL